MSLSRFLLSIVLSSLSAIGMAADGVPDKSTLQRPFDVDDRQQFVNPPRINYPETWFHFIGGNVSLEGITADLEAIARAGISGVQLFHGQFGDKWPATGAPIACLSDKWDEAVLHVANECKRLGLKFSMQNCPGWAMAGGPWISEENAMRTIVHSEVFTDGKIADVTLPVPQPSSEDWRDYRDIAILAFPTPDGDLTPLIPTAVTCNQDLPWEELINAKRELIQLPPSPTSGYSFTVILDEITPLRTVVLPSIESLSHAWCYEPGVHVSVDAMTPSGEINILDTDLPSANWQDKGDLSLACREVHGVKEYQVTIHNSHSINLRQIKFLSAARKNNWEAEAAHTLRSAVRDAEDVQQSTAAYICSREIYDVTDKMAADGTLRWEAPHDGSWTIMRFGHVNSGSKNGPAPPEGTGWECNKLSTTGADTHFAGYIGRLKDNVLGETLQGVLLDSWECGTQTWTAEMENEFLKHNGYALRTLLPSLTGYVIDTPEDTYRFLNDWRRVINRLFTDNFYGRIALNAHNRGLTVAYETAAGDVFPADIMEYFKYADIPMCEFWHPFTNGYVGSLNFKPVLPTASAAHLYGKPRVAAESFTSFDLSWDEHWEMLKGIADYHAVEGVTHNVFHTYTHNPQVGFLPPGSSFGSNIGTPFLRGQTWWPYMKSFTDYLARCSYMLERGRPVASVLWYLGDEINHKPSQTAPFPSGYRYDYCNPDVLLNFLEVKDGKLVTRDGTEYEVLWLPDCKRLRIETLKQLYKLITQGATVVGNVPVGLATLTGGQNAEKLFKKLTDSIWKNALPGSIKKIGKGQLISGVGIDTALSLIGATPDVIGNVRWNHRCASGADWYFVTPQKGESFNGVVSFAATGHPEIWNPVDGSVKSLDTSDDGQYTDIVLDLPTNGSAFIVFNHAMPEVTSSTKNFELPDTLSLTDGHRWTLEFKDGRGAPDSISLTKLQWWKDLDTGDDGRAYSGTAVYKTGFNLDSVTSSVLLDMGEVDMIARVKVNDTEGGTVWCHPYTLDISEYVHTGENTLEIEVTGTWHNRLVRDAGLPEDKRQTWTVGAPAADAELTPSGMTGPVYILLYK